jgi:tripartite-type tricarboxylate transporter receptor subunit TctC
MKRLLWLLLFVLVVVIPTIASASWQPPKTVTAIIGFQPGSGNELAFRKSSSIVSKDFPDITFIVKNMPGADSVNGMNEFVKEKADGSVVGVPSHMGTYVTNDIWQKQIKKFNHDDFISLLTLGKSPLVLVAHKSSKVNTPAEFVDYIKKTNNTFIAVGGGAHRTAYEYIVDYLKLDKQKVTNVNFNGPAPAVESVAKFDGPQGTEFGIMPLAVALPFIQDGMVKAIGLTADRKMPQAPQIALLTEAIPGVNVYAAWTLALPKDTPPEVVKWYQTNFTKAIKSAEYKEWADKNMIFVEDKELTPEGLKVTIENLRSTFLPVLQKLDPSREVK